MSLNTSKTDELQLMSPTVEWMEEKYNEMNKLLFNNSLKGCKFEIFTTGKGSQGNVLGWFKVDGNIKIESRTRKMYHRNVSYEKEYANYDNFVRICEPCIQLNGNYKWTEKAALSTLVHEMCHYYTYMYGVVPKQVHGREFKNIALIVSSKSSGFFTVERIASAEQMGEMKLDESIKAKNDKRLENKKNRVIVVVIQMNNGETRLINANGRNVVNMVVKAEKKHKIKNAKCIKISNNDNLKNSIFDAGYSSSMMTYRYWDITKKKDLLDKINEFEFEEIINL